MSIDETALVSSLADALRPFVPPRFIVSSHGPALVVRDTLTREWLRSDLSKASADGDGVLCVRIETALSTMQDFVTEALHVRWPPAKGSVPLSYIPLPAATIVSGMLHVRFGAAEAPDLSLASIPL